MDPAILATGLVKRFPVPRSWREIVVSPAGRRHRTALDGVDLAILPGEVFGLLGPNGAGKTTLLRILAAIVVPTAGHTLVAGVEPATCPVEARRLAGHSFAPEKSFYARLTGRQNLAFFAALHGIARREARPRVDLLLDRLGLADSADDRFQSYSSGMQARLGLARALFADPPVLLLDEPTRSLDPPTAAWFRRFLAEDLAGGSGKTVLMATHSLEEARSTCRRAAWLDRGKVAFLGTPNDLEKFIAAQGVAAPTAGGPP